MYRDDQIDPGYDYVPLSHYVGVIVRSWRLITGVVVLFAVLAVAMVLRTPRAYAARTQLLVTQPVVERVFDGAPVETLSVDVLSALGQARDLFQKVADNADLRDADTGDRLTAQEVQEMTTLTVVRVEGSGSDAVTLPLLSLRATSSDPEQAALIANTWASVFITENSRFVTSEVSRTYEFASSRFEEVRSELEGKEQELLEFRLENPLEPLKTQLAVLTERYNASLTELEADRASLVAERTDLASAEEAFAAEDEFIELENTIPTDVLLLLVAVDGPAFDPDAFPELVARNQQLNTLYFSLKGQIVAGRSAVARLTSRIEFLESDIARLDTEVASLTERINRAEVTITRLDRDIGFLTVEFASLGETAQLAQLAAAEEAGSIQVVEAAVAPTTPASRGGVRTLALAGVLGLLLGSLLALTRNYLRENPDTGPRAARGTGSMQWPEPGWHREGDLSKIVEQTREGADEAT
ncbi:MAG TPA: GNVR domain-containing protein [Acidimicrobiia bacterium]|nr:GNVR domain-containing protein [Acidimicrobiia bacterium]